MTNQPTHPDRLQKIRVGNVPEGTSEAQLSALFAAHGKVGSYERPVDAHTGRPGAFAYVGMAPADAAQAIAKLNRHIVGGAELNVSALNTQAPWGPEADRSPRSRQPARVVTAPTPGRAPRG